MSNAWGVVVANRAQSRPSQCRPCGTLTGPPLFFQLIPQGFDGENRIVYATSLFPFWPTLSYVSASAARTCWRLVRGEQLTHYLPSRDSAGIEQAYPSFVHRGVNDELQGEHP